MTLQDVIDDLHPITTLEELVEEIEVDEGWRSLPYNDHLGKLTIGYGTLLEEGIDKTEGKFLMLYRLSKNVDQFERLTDIELTDLPREKALVLANMCYQLGPTGLSKFRNMLSAIQREDWTEAGKQGRYSRWYKQTPNRAEKLMRIMES